MFLVGSGFGIANDDAVGSSRSHVILLWEVHGFAVGLELIGVMIRSFEDRHGRECCVSSGLIPGKSISLLGKRTCMRDIEILEKRKGRDGKSMLVFKSTMRWRGGA